MKIIINDELRKKYGNIALFIRDYKNDEVLFKGLMQNCPNMEIEVKYFTYWPKDKYVKQELLTIEYIKEGTQND